jgi:excisionase family DNA binding protein
VQKNRRQLSEGSSAFSRVEPDSPPALRLAFRPDEVVALIGLSRGSVYEAIRNGSLQSTRYGRRILVSRDAIEAFLVNGQQRGSK